jgi:hypothetical protein
VTREEAHKLASDMAGAWSDGGRLNGTVGERLAMRDEITAALIAAAEAERAQLQSWLRYSAKMYAHLVEVHEAEEAKGARALMGKSEACCEINNELLGLADAIGRRLG